MTLAIGGWNEGSQNYSIMARDPNKRKVFAASALSFIRRHNFDGLDLDWEYPGKRGGVKEDKKNFILLIKDLYKVFRPQNLMLTAAIGASAATIDAAYDIPEMYKYLDYVHVMCYDYHGEASSCYPPTNHFDNNNRLFGEDQYGGPYVIIL